MKQKLKITIKNASIFVALLKFEWASFGHFYQL